MNNLSYTLLVETYHQAKALNLAFDFVRIIRKEMVQRALLEYTGINSQSTIDCRVTIRNLRLYGIIP